MSNLAQLTFLQIPPPEERSFKVKSVFKNVLSKRARVLVIRISSEARPYVAALDWRLKVMIFLLYEFANLFIWIPETYPQPG